MGVETLFPKGAKLDMWDASWKNYFAANEGKSLTCRVFIKAEMILLCLCAEFIFKSFFTQLFNTILFKIKYKYNKDNIRYKSVVIR